MDTWIELARGPLFRISLTIMVLGLAYRVGLILAQLIASWRRATDKQMPWKMIFAATIGWLIPKRLLKTRPLYSIASFLFHVGIILVPLFLVGHTALLDRYIPSWWPNLAPLWSDILTVVAIVALAWLIGGRIMTATARALSKTQDVVILAILLMMLLCGFLASHPPLSPLHARTMLLMHMLLGNLTLIMFPTTKIVHCVLYPFTQLIFELGWHFPAATGQHVARVLGKENEPV